MQGDGSGMKQMFITENTPDGGIGKEWSKA